MKYFIDCGGGYEEEYPSIVELQEQIDRMVIRSEVFCLENWIDRDTQDINLQFYKIHDENNKMFSVDPDGSIVELRNEFAINPVDQVLDIALKFMEGDCYAFNTVYHNWNDLINDFSVEVVGSNR